VKQDEEAEIEHRVPAIPYKAAAAYAEEVRMRLQRVGIAPNNVSSLAVGSHVCLRDFKLCLLNKLGFKNGMD